MKMKPSMKLHFTLLGISLSVIFLLSSCVKIPTEAPPLPNLKAKVRVIHAATDLGEVNVKLDGRSIATLAMESSSAYIDLNAGKHTFQVGEQPVDTLFIDTDFVGTVYLATVFISDGDTTDRFIKKRERWMFNPPSPDTLATVFFAQMSHTIAYKVYCSGDYSDSDTSFTDNGTLDNTLTYTKFASMKIPHKTFDVIDDTTTKYYPISNWTYTFYVVSDSDTLLTITPTLSLGKAVTEVLLNPKANLTVKEFSNE